MEVTNLCFSLFVSSLIFLLCLSWTSPAEALTDKECAKLNSSCYVCTESSSCYWCGPTKKCSKYPVGSIIPRDCKGHKWFYKQCTVQGYWLIIVIPCLAVVFLISLGCCIWCCCCRKSKSKREEKFRLEDVKLRKERERRKAAQSQKKADRQEKVDEIRKKYGLYQHEPSYQKMQEIE